MPEVEGSGSGVVRKKWRIQEVMVVPAQWQGSVEHFYHFFLGYFMPLVVWQQRTGTTAFSVRDCGPMNPWFSLLRPDSELTYMPPGVMLQRVLTRRQTMQVLHGWDDPTRFHRQALDEFVSAVVPRVGESPADHDTSQRRITVLHRAPSPDFYLSAASETYSSGAAWRSLPNTEDIATQLERLGTVQLLDTAALSPAQQVSALAATDILVAQHGAGLANMVWMRRGSAVLEIKPPLPPTINEIFQNLAAARGLDHLASQQQDEHSAVDVSAIVEQVQRLIDQRGAFIPRMPGKAPVRLLRRLPRRL